MYVIEITDDKIESVLDHLSKSMRCLGKVAECLESWRDGGDDYERDDDGEDETEMRRARYGTSRDSGHSRKMYRSGGRYGR